MDILSSETINYKLCAKCQTLKPESKFYRKNDWCRKCLKEARDNVAPGKKHCTICKSVKDIGEFHTSSVYGETHIHSWCEPCHREKHNASLRDKYTPYRGRDQNLRRKYGLSLEEYEAMLEAQGGVCACCKQAETYIHHRSKQIYPLHVDHDHKTGKIRGLLCSICNQTLGKVKEDPEWLKALLRYLEERCL